MQGPVADQYEILTQVKGSLGGDLIRLGARGVCRFCQTTEARAFKKEAHAFPVSFGNHWILSLDECDHCNEHVFSRYEDALAKAIGPILTLGGTRGRGRKVRQTGRSASATKIRREDGDGRPRIFAQAELDDPRMYFAGNPQTGDIRLPILTPNEPFVPRYAYKALVKMAFSLLPKEEFGNYRKLLAWLIDVDDRVDFPILEVGASFGSVGNAPDLVCGTLLRRRSLSAPVPHIIFLFCAGSICLQIELLSDQLEDHIRAVGPGSVNIGWSVVMADELGETEIKIDYGKPTFVNWASSNSEAPFIESIALDFNTRTTDGNFTPVIRRNTILKI